MNTVYYFALSFTACSFAVFIINYFVPEGNLKNITTLVLVLFIIVSVIKPVKEIKKSDFKIDYTESEYNLENNTVGIIKTNIRKLTDDALNEIGINDYELIIDVDLNDGEAVIKEYTINIDNINKTEAVKSAVLKKVGIEPEVGEIE